MRSALEAITQRNQQNRRFQAATCVAAATALAIGVFMVAAWHSHNAWLADTFPSIFYMKYNTSLAFAAGGAGLLAAQFGNKFFTLAAAGVVLAIGGLTLIQYLTGANLGIDEFLLVDYLHPDNPLRGRMAPSAALALTCFSATLILLAAEAKRGLSHLMTMEALSFVVLAVGATAVAGHLTQAGFAYSWGTTARVAPEAGAGFMALGVGLVALTWQYQSIRVARVPLWLPAMLCFGVLLLDLSTPRGPAIGIAYIPIIFCSLWFTRPYTVFVFAAIATALAVLGYFASPPSELAVWISTTNRGLTIGALWFVATLVYLRRRSDFALQRYMAELERSNQELDDFAYIASHDLKEPLRGLFNHTQFLREDYADKLDEDGVRRLMRVGQLCQRMEQLINDLMYFSRLGRAEMAIQETDLNAVIVDIQKTMDVFVEERHAQIAVPRSLPKTLCDPVRTAEVFRNLITNAIKYNDKAKPLVEIGFLHSAIKGAGVERNVFYVKDNGIGIEPEFHQEIFRIFKRLQKPSSATETGTGVGLTFVKKIIERQGGRIWLDSEIGIGTTFYFTLIGHEGGPAMEAPAKDSHEPSTIPVAAYSAG